jgi:hypothetical protein
MFRKRGQAVLALNKEAYIRRKVSFQEFTSGKTCGF